LEKLRLIILKREQKYMKRMKKFLIYALLVAALWIFSDIVIFLTINGIYKPKEARVYVSSPEIIITENKATYVNGVIKGNIKNNTQEIMNDKFLKIDMYSARDVNLGTKYVKINNLKPNQSREFEMGYQFTDVNYTIVTMVDNVENVSEEELASQNVGFYLIFGKLMFLYFML
jgi:ABC-type Na+ efflux pump permease subunit